MAGSHYTYLLVNACCILIPLLASFHPKTPFYKEWKYYLPANIIVATVFLIWDAYFTGKGIWGFNSRYITGIILYNLPLEEILFFICIPYACSYTYYVYRELTRLNFKYVSAMVAYILAIMLSVVAFQHVDKWYTATTFFSLSLLLVWSAAKNRNVLQRFLPVYALIFIPFILSNGLLTGNWLAEPIVWYNNSHILGPRLMTIPVEDAFYAMLLLLLNITGYEWVRKATARYGYVAGTLFKRYNNGTL